MFQNKYVAIWVLYLKSSHVTSMHCHPQKKTSLIVLDGKVTCTTLEGWYDRDVLEALIIQRGVFHSTQATSPKGALIIEIETPPVKEDLARLKDTYGRAGKAYEGVDKMSKNLNRFDYIDFHNFKLKPQVKKIRKRSMTTIRGVEFSSDKRRGKDSLICLLKGRVTTHNNTPFFAVGEVIDYDTFAISELKMSNDSVFLIIE